MVGSDGSSGADETDRPDDDLYHAVSRDELGDGDRILVDVEGREIAVFNSGGEFHAVLNFCPHQGGPLCEGLLDGTLTMTDEWEWTYGSEGEVVSCPWHGWEFDITTGEHLSNSEHRVPTYEVVVRDGEVYVRA